MYKTTWLYIVLIMLLLLPAAKAQPGNQWTDTLFVDGPNLEHLSKYLSFWVDSSGKAGIEEATAALRNGKFKHWTHYSTLNLGLNPKPLWLHLQVKNIALEPGTYWWALYSHADTVEVFEKKHTTWQAIDTILYARRLSDRKIKVRFAATSVHLKPGEHSSLLLKVQNYRHTQHAITDFTTPGHNLLWEKKFYWYVGLFSGCFLLTGLISLITGIVLRKKIFMLFGVYLLLILCMNLMEELMVPVVSNKFIFYFLARSHSLPVAIVALSIHYHIILYILNPAKTTKLIRRLSSINNVILVYGGIYWLSYFLFMDTFHHGRWPYNMLWNLGIAAIFIIMLLTVLMIFLSVYKKKYWLIVAVAAILLLYFNPAGYFLNYAGIIQYYNITYPNYFYWIVIAEMICIGSILAWQYKKTEREHYELIKQNALQEERILQREIEILEEERKQIARDLHDDLGTTLSATKLIITNSYAHDKKLVNMITRANTDLRHFFNQLSLSDLHEFGIVKLLRWKVNECNSIGTIHFMFISIGEENAIPISLKLNILRIGTELLSNVLKHSKASESTLQLIIEPGQVLLMIEDNGTGIDLSKTRKGMGLDNIGARVQRWNGEVHISGSQSGTTTIITIPLIHKT
ncbi:hypothetical protein COR50_19000 [Chitinophaga caeni]|uniref:histidine kinase n=2 Tax=Chitinophaga caeni TaxID=2029983 RepID=A0A291QYR6_9BACT|nr:hypothetical protein COR50_19000 [Chitinophaga caeni]